MDTLFQNFRVGIRSLVVNEQQSVIPGEWRGSRCEPIYRSLAPCLDSLPWLTCFGSSVTGRSTLRVMQCRYGLHGSDSSWLVGSASGRCGLCELRLTDSVRTRHRCRRACHQRPGRLPLMASSALMLSTAARGDSSGPVCLRVERLAVEVEVRDAQTGALRADSARSAVPAHVFLPRHAIWRILCFG